MSGTDNSHLAEKLRVAAAVASARPLGAMEQVWMPYCGRGLAYQALASAWPPEAVVACDRDVGCVKAFREEWPSAEVREELAERASFVGVGPFAVGWFDAYNSPFRAVRHWLHSAAVCRRVGVVLTTAIRGYMVRRSQTYDFQRLGWGRYDRAAMREQVDAFPSVVAGWMGSLDGVEQVEQVDAWQASGGSWICYAGYVLALADESPTATSSAPQAQGESWRETLSRLRGAPIPDASPTWADALAGVRR